MDVNELRDDANLYGSTSFEIRKNDLYGKINKLLTRCEARLEDIELSGRKTTREGKEEYKIVKHMAECYTKLYNSDINNEKDYEDVAWMFNNGNLRTDWEIRNHCDIKEQEKYKEEVYDIAKTAGHILQDDVEDLTNWGAFAIGSTLAATICFSDFGNMNIEAMGLLFLPALLIGFVVSKAVGLLINIKIEKSLQEKARKAGVKKTIGTPILFDAATLGASLLGLRNIFKKKK